MTAKIVKYREMAKATVSLAIDRAADVSTIKYAFATIIEANIPNVDFKDCEEAAEAILNWFSHRKVQVLE